MDQELENETNNAAPHSRGGARIRKKGVLYNPWFQRISVLMVVGAIAFGISFIWRESRIPIFHDPATLVTLRYPHEVMRLGVISEDDKRAKIVFRAQEGEKDSATPYLVTVRYEEGLRKVSSMLRYDILDILTDNVGKLFPGQYPKFEKVEEKRYFLNGKKAAEIVTTYLSPVGEEVKQRFIIVMRDEDMALYITAQAKKKDFDSLNRKYFENILSSLRFQLK
jgi:hypothetical protein